MEILITCCDLCNIDAKLHNPYRLPPGLVETLDVEYLADENGDVWVNKGVYVGEASKAMAEEGWEENDYGVICSLCALNEKNRESEDDGCSAGLGAIDAGSEIDYDEIVKGPK